MASSLLDLLDTHGGDGRRPPCTRWILTTAMPARVRSGVVLSATELVDDVLSITLFLQKKAEAIFTVSFGRLHTPFFHFSRTVTVKTIFPMNKNGKSWAPFVSIDMTRVSISSFLSSRRSNQESATTCQFCTELSHVAEERRVVIERFGRKGTVVDAKVVDGVRYKIKKRLKHFRKASEGERAAEEFQEEMAWNFGECGGASAVNGRILDLDDIMYSCEQEVGRPINVSTNICQMLQSNKTKFENRESDFTGILEKPRCWDGNKPKSIRSWVENQEDRSPS